MLVIDEASMLSVPQMLWLVKHARQSDTRVLLVGDSAQHRSVAVGTMMRYEQIIRDRSKQVPELIS
jgi:ATP-dependent exoDNAse (exonuclease V) alpha subunit